VVTDVRTINLFTAVSNKWADYTRDTISKLLTDGKQLDKKATVSVTRAGGADLDNNLIKEFTNSDTFSKTWR
jgi:hypothetical protein